MRRDLTRAELLAIAALYEVAGAASQAPVRPSLSLRALLAFLYAQRTQGGRLAYQEYWYSVINTDDREANAGYVRATNARTHWNGIVRSIGLEPQSQELHEAICQMIDRQRRAVDAEWRARREAAERVKLGKYDREIISTKGHPHSEAGKTLMDDRVARGEDAA